MLQHIHSFIKDTAVQKLMAVCDKALAFRKEQEDALGHSGGCSHARAKKLGDVTTLNLTSETPDQIDPLLRPACLPACLPACMLARLPA